MPHLISIDENDLLDVEREEDVEEENLITPDDALFLRLLVEPTWPLVLHQLVLEPVLLGQHGKEVLGGKVIMLLFIYT